MTSSVYAKKVGEFVFFFFQSDLVRKVLGRITFFTQVKRWRPVHSVFVSKFSSQIMIVSGKEPEPLNLDLQVGTKSLIGDPPVRRRLDTIRLHTRSSCVFYGIFSLPDNSSFSFSIAIINY